MEGILKNWRGFVNEGITSQGKIIFNYYAFDWDDNLMKMPTKILFKKTGSHLVPLTYTAGTNTTIFLGKIFSVYAGLNANGGAAHFFTALDSTTILALTNNNSEANVYLTIIKIVI